MQLRDSNDSNDDNSGDFEEVDFEFLNGSPAPEPSCIWLNAYHRGMSRGEVLVTPAQYRALLNLTSNASTADTWLTYSLSWEPSHVTWSLNGAPLLRRTAGEVVRWADMRGRPYA